MTDTSKPLTADEITEWKVYGGNTFYFRAEFAQRIWATIEQRDKQIERLRDALDGTVEAITRDTQEHGGISGYTGARLVDAREALAATEPLNDKR